MDAQHKQWFTSGYQDETAIEVDIRNLQSCCRWRYCTEELPRTAKVLVSNLFALVDDWKRNHQRKWVRDHLGH